MIPEAKDEPGYSLNGFLNLGGGYWQSAELVAAVADPTDEEREDGWNSMVYAVGTNPTIGGGRLCKLPVSEVMLLVRSIKELMARHPSR